MEMIRQLTLNSKVTLLFNINPIIEHFVIKPDGLWHRVGNGEISICSLPKNNWKLIGRLRDLDISTDEKFYKVEAFRKQVKEALMKNEYKTEIKDLIDFENILIVTII